MYASLVYAFGSTHSSNRCVCGCVASTNTHFLIVGRIYSRQCVWVYTFLISSFFVSLISLYHCNNLYKCFFFVVWCFQLRFGAYWLSTTIVSQYHICLNYFHAMRYVTVIYHSLCGPIESVHFNRKRHGNGNFWDKKRGERRNRNQVCNREEKTTHSSQYALKTSTLAEKSS